MPARWAADRGRRRRGHRHLRAAAVAVQAILAMWSGPADAQEGSLEAAIKATYLAKFEPFVDWPPNTFPAPASPVVICAIGNDTLGQLLDRAADGQHIGERPIVVRRLERTDGETGCHILYVAGDERAVAEALGAVRGAPVLTVTDQSAGPKGIINFVIRDNRVRFEVDEAKAARDGLKISSKLLSLAVAITPPG